MFVDGEPMRSEMAEERESGDERRLHCSLSETDEELRPAFFGRRHLGV